MQGKVVVITGATSGVGQVAAERLAGMGARIVQIARDRSRGEAAMARLRSIAPDQDHSIHYGDLSLMSEAKRLADVVAAAEPRIDVLMNNAGGIFGRRIETAEGLEYTFALNHMSYFLFTFGLRERLLATPGARILNTASEAHRKGHINFDDLQATKYQPFRRYGTSKLCNILFTRELARRLDGTGVTANSLHPGFVATRFGDAAGGGYDWGLRIAKVFAITPEKGAAIMIKLASSPDVAGVTGEFFEHGKPARTSREAQNDDVARRLWAESERIAGISW